MHHVVLDKISLRKFFGLSILFEILRFDSLSFHFQVKKSTIFTKHHSYVNLTDKSYNTNFELDNANSWDLVFSSYEKWSGSQVVKKPIGVFINNGVLNISFSEIPGRPSTYDIPKIYTQSYDSIGDPSLLTIRSYHLRLVVPLLR